MQALFVLILAATSTLAMTVRPPCLGGRDDSDATEVGAYIQNSTSPTLTVSLREPTPTQTEAAVTSAYAVYVQMCGPNYSQVVQAALADYNSFTSPPATSYHDPAFQNWFSLSPKYDETFINCLNSEVNLLSAEDSARSSTSSAPTDTSSTPTPSESQTSVSETTQSTAATSTSDAPESSQDSSVSGSSSASSSGSASVTGSSTASSSASSSAPSPSQTTGAAASHGPHLLFVLFGLWVVQRGLMG
ncbi:hypothetical protein FB451DRAFT_1477901 [Mycena latifolia]|nr:hypothetical protein FB451DRAFT_1477901 [Mycena latifolia]